MNLLEPWVLLRLAAGLVACLLFGWGAWTAQKILRRFELGRATEGQLALEKQLELAATFVRVGAVVQVAGLALAVLGADRMSRGVRGAMCAYGVFAATPLGVRSLGVTAAVALGAGVLAQVYAFDARVRAFELARPLALATLAIFPFAVFDLALSADFLGALDLSAVASCCSVQLDPVAATGDGYATGPRVLSSVLALVGVAAAIGLGLFAARAPTKARVVVAGGAALLTLPVAFVASVLEVAPHAFEVPHHVCPFCLLRPDVFGVGYPLYGALFMAATWGLGAGVSALLSRGAASRAALAPFATVALRRAAVAWALVLVLGAAPVVRFTVVSGGASLFASEHTGHVDLE